MISSYIIAIVACLLFSAFFSASEMAYSSCNRVRLENARDDGDKRAAVAVRITEKYDDALSAILIGNNLVNIAASSLGSVAVILLTASAGYAWLSTLIITVAVILFGETVPKIAAKKNANRYALINAYVIRFLMVVLKPVTWLIVGLVNLMTRGLKGESEDDGDDGAAVEELQSIIDTAEDESVLDEDQSELVKAAIDFSDVSAYEVMTARVDMTALDADDDWDEILRTIDASPYSRLPVYQNSVDNIIGVLYLNHFLKALVDRDKVDIKTLLMQPCYVYKTMKLPAVLTELRKAQQHLAIVTDEYGGTLGVVSMEDVLEQIVGDIWDETDTVEPDIIEQAEGVWELDGDMSISDFLELMGWDEDSFDCESETVGGWTIEMFEGFPKSGDQFEYANITVTVLETDGRRVGRVLVRQNPKPDLEA
ncbi:MAG TPA: hemolysin family protein [Oscillospiraceae bacterium]|nr:hemolysin family protein [Oscillospiraceae bacterium]